MTLWLGVFPLFLISSVVISKMYTLTDLTTNGFGATVGEIKISDLLNSENKMDTVKTLEEDLHKHRILVFHHQNITSKEQIEFGELFGPLYNQAHDINRKEFGKNIDPRIAIFSNDPAHGVVGVGIEGFHVDGNVAPVPHKATMIYCKNAIKGGDTLFVPLNEVVKNFEGGSDQLDGIYFRSSHVPDNIHPIVYPHPSTGKDTMMFGLGSLSGLYMHYGKEMTKPQTNAIIKLIETTIQKVGPYQYQWKNGDLVMVDNLAVAHLAVAGTQSTENGIRIMRRTTLLGSNTPSLRRPMESFPHRCDTSVCIVSLAKYVDYELGKFDSRDASRRLCKYALHPEADLVSISTLSLNMMATSLIRETAVPHWINANEENHKITWLDGSVDEWSHHPWHVESGQPNDCSGPGSEPCVFIGPGGQWFDFACAPKTSPDDTPGPEITWTTGKRRMYNVYPMCQLSANTFVVSKEKQEL